MPNVIESPESGGTAAAVVAAGASPPVVGGEDGSAQEQELLELVMAFVSRAEIGPLNEFFEEVQSAVEGRRRSLEDEALQVMEGVAAQFGRSLSDWVGGGTRALAAGAGGDSSGSRGRMFDVDFWFNPWSGAWSPKLGQRPGWVRALLAEGYSEEQLSRPSGSFSESKGRHFWVDPETGRFFRADRPGTPKWVSALLDRGRNLREVTRPPGSFSSARGRVEPGALPAPLEGALPSPEGSPETED